MYALGIKRALFAMSYIVAVFVLSFLPHANDGGAWGIVQRVFLYRSKDLDIGLQAILPASVLTLLLFALSFAVPLLCRRWTLAEQLQATGIVYVIFAPGISAVHYVPLFAVWALTPNPMLTASALFVTLPVLLSRFYRAMPEAATLYNLLMTASLVVCVVYLLTLIRKYQHTTEDKSPQSILIPRKSG